jgi:hypothetical protein
MFCPRMHLHVLGGLASLPIQSWRISRENLSRYACCSNPGRLRRVFHSRKQRKHESRLDLDVVVRINILIGFNFQFLILFFIGCQHSR